MKRLVKFKDTCQMMKELMQSISGVQDYISPEQRDPEFDKKMDSILQLAKSI